MELHHHWKTYAIGPVSLVVAVVALFSPQLLAAIGYEFTLGPWVGYIRAAVFGLAGIANIWLSLTPLGVHLAPEGVAWRKDGKPVGIRWQDVLRVTVEKRNIDEPRSRSRFLTVWTLASSLGEGVAPDVRLPDRYGYRVVDLTDVKESSAQVDAALHHFAPGRYWTATP